MGLRTMKQDLFVMKALESKGYDLAEVSKWEDSELDKLPISTKLIESIKDYKKRGCKTAEEISNEIANLMLETEVSEESIQAATHYKDNTEEQQSIIEEIQSSVVIPEGEVEIIRQESSKEDVDVIVEALSQRDFKSFAPFLKHLKSVVPQQILTSVDGTTLNSLIEKRISEVKEQSENTK